MLNWIFDKISSKIKRFKLNSNLTLKWTIKKITSNTSFRSLRLFVKLMTRVTLSFLINLLYVLGIDLNKAKPYIIMLEFALIKFIIIFTLVAFIIRVWNINTFRELLKYFYDTLKNIAFLILNLILYYVVLFTVLNLYYAILRFGHKRIFYSISFIKAAIVFFFDAFINMCNFIWDITFPGFFCFIALVYLFISLIYYALTNIYNKYF